MKSVCYGIIISKLEYARGGWTLPTKYIQSYARTNPEKNPQVYLFYLYLLYILYQKVLYKKNGKVHNFIVLQVFF